METTLASLPGYQVYEYKIVLVPHADLIEKIKYIRKAFNEKYKVEHPIAALPEITLVAFKQLRVGEARIASRLKAIADGSPHVKVEIKDFGSYPSHTIFLNVTTKEPLKNLIKKITHDAGRLMKLDGDNKPHFMNDTHFTLARKLKPWQYEQGWLEYSNSHFTGKFMATNMLLMRRKLGEGRYQPVERFEFNNLPVDTVQGALF